MCVCLTPRAGKGGVNQAEGEGGLCCEVFIVTLSFLSFSFQARARLGCNADARVSKRHPFPVFFWVNFPVLSFLNLKTFLSYIILCVMISELLKLFLSVS